MSTLPTAPVIAANRVGEGTLRGRMARLDKLSSRNFSVRRRVSTPDGPMLATS